MICLTNVFVPVAIETAGAFGPRTLVFLRELGRRMSDCSGEKKEHAYLFQRLNGHAAWECHLHLGQPEQQSLSLTFIYSLT